MRGDGTREGMLAGAARGLGGCGRAGRGSGEKEVITPALSCPSSRGPPWAEQQHWAGLCSSRNPILCAWSFTGGSSLSLSSGGGRPDLPFPRYFSGGRLSFPSPTPTPPHPTSPLGPGELGKQRFPPGVLPPGIHALSPLGPPERAAPAPARLWSLCFPFF